MNGPNGSSSQHNSQESVNQTEQEEPGPRWFIHAAAALNCSSL